MKVLSTLRQNCRKTKIHQSGAAEVILIKHIVSDEIEEKKTIIIIDICAT